MALATDLEQKSRHMHAGCLNAPKHLIKTKRASVLCSK